MRGARLVFVLLLGALLSVALADLLSLGNAARLVPLLVVVPTLLLLGAQATLEAGSALRPAGAEAAPVPWRAEARAFAMVLGLVGGCALFGLLVAVPGFAALSTRFVVRAGWPTSLAAGLAAALVIWLLFPVVLSRPVPGGIWMPWP